MRWMIGLVHVLPLARAVLPLPLFPKLQKQRAFTLIRVRERRWQTTKSSDIC